jgi:hypothetical protein
MADISNGPNSFFQPPAQGPGATEVVQQLQGIVRQLTALVSSINGRAVFGTFTMPAAATFTINQTSIKSNSVIQLNPTNASAATLQGSAKSLYTTISAGTSFTVNTADGAAAVGTETFSYSILTPT